MKLLWLLLPLAPSVFSKPTNDSESLVWGAYRPNLYFGLRPRLPQSLMTGLAWFGTQDYQSITREHAVCTRVGCVADETCCAGIRHACDQGDGLDGYSWTEYDAREGGEQVIKDGVNNVKITTEFLKVPGGEHGGSWAARIKGEPIDPSKSHREGALETYAYCAAQHGHRASLPYSTLGWRAWAELTWTPWKTKTSVIHRPL